MSQQSLAVVAAVALAGSGCATYSLSTDQRTKRGYGIALGVEAVAAGMMATWFALDKRIDVSEQAMNRAILGGGLVLGVDVFAAAVVSWYREGKGDP